MTPISTLPPTPAARPRDTGSALLVVLVTMTVVIGLISVGLNYALNAMKSTDRAADWAQALPAAEAGVDDYLARLNRNDGYWRSGPAGLADCGNVALRGNPAVTKTASSCGWGVSTPLGWRKVVGSTDAEFHYDVDVSDTPIDGTIKLRSTGRINGVTRTVQVTLRRGGFGEFLYYTVYETIDPADEPTYGLSSTTAQTRCTKYLWNGRTLPTAYGGSDKYCSLIRFITNDRINGPMHTNDVMISDGSPRFLGTVTTSYPSCKPAADGTPKPAASCYGRLSGNATFDKGIAYRDEIELPTSIGDLRQHVTAGSTTAARLGCLYTGPTRIKYLPPPSSGVARMTVWSKYSLGTLNPGCGVRADLNSTAGATIDVPQNKVIMVQNVPAAQASPPSGGCATGAVGDGIPVANDYNTVLRESDCRYGTLYVEGTLKGRVTMATDNNIIITGDLAYAGGATGTDALGLIAENSVKIYHPVQRGSCRTMSGSTCIEYNWTNLLRNGGRPVLTNVSMHAAVLTLQHSFGVQSYAVGARLGTLKVFGSLAQRFRGPVGTGSSSSGTGYLKDYNYDSRLRYSPPPYFLDPVKSGWGQKVFGEVPPLYGD